MKPAPRLQLPAAPTALSLLKELEAHFRQLYAQPEALARAPQHFLGHWLLLVRRVQRLLPDE